MDECCEVRRKLAEAFAMNARLYAESVVNLTWLHNISQEDYDRYREAAEMARQRTEQASVAFEEHVASHSCGESSQTQPEASA